MERISLYQIVTDIKAILDRTTDDGEFDGDLEMSLNALEHDLPIKLDNVERYRRQVRATGEAYKAEADRLYELAAAEDRKDERLKDYIQASLTTLGITKLDTDLFKFSVCRNGQPSVTWDGDTVPEGFERVKIELDSRKVVEAWKQGAKLPEGMKVEQGQHLRIK